MAAYDDFWGERPLRPQLAVRINLPTRLAKRDAAVAEGRNTSTSGRRGWPA